MPDESDLDIRLGPDGGALFSPCGAYRYQLWRTWNLPSRRVCWIMLNPSTATESVLDPTVRRCMGFSRQWGCGGLRVVNLFALRATDPKQLKEAQDPVGPENDKCIKAAVASAELVVCAWGTHGKLLGRGAAVQKLLAYRHLHHLGLTKEGHPKHPLYLKKDLLPIPY